MLGFAEKLLSRVTWTKGDLACFLGEYLTLPKPHVVFRPGRGRRSLGHSVVRLDPKSQLLYRGAQFFINGEAVNVPRRAAAALRELADRREASGGPLARAGLAKLISGWQRLGYLHLERP